MARCVQETSSPRHCSYCAHARRKCERCGLIKLSWPKVSDRRRAIVTSLRTSASLKTVPHTRCFSRASFINTSCADIEVHHRLHSLPRSASPTSGNSAGPGSASLPPDLIIWNPTKLSTRHRELLDYFRLVASKSLATFGQEPDALGEVIVRIATTNSSKIPTTASSHAALKALLAFASLHRHGQNAQAWELKVSALGYLAQASPIPQGRFNAVETIQHVAACMLLSSFEVHQSSCSAGQWTSYLDGAKTVINAASPLLKTLDIDGDAAVLLDWVYYHEILTRYSMCYWKQSACPELPPPTMLNKAQSSRLSAPVSSMLALLSEVCEAVTLSVDRSDDFKSFLGVLDWRIRSIELNLPSNSSLAEESHCASVLRLYQLALLIYLDRASEGRLDHPKETQNRINKAFDILSCGQLQRYCKQQFPIFIVGCEAATDEQRSLILDIISGTETRSCSRAWTHCSLLVQAVWAQEDLAIRGDGREQHTVTYRDKMAAVFSMCRILPTFV